ncbi:MAG: homoserine kinase [Sarcina sp.]
MKIRVKVPATSANVGPGFDSIGLAVELYNVFEFEEIESGIEFSGFDEKFSNTDNVVYTSMNYVFEKLAYNLKGIKIYLIEQNIPVARGLGSSSSCIVAGIIGANYLCGNKFSKNELLDIAVEIEGHPDNVAPAILGGIIVSVVESGKVYYNKIELDNDLKFLTLIPNFELATTEARKALPKEYKVSDAIYNVSRAALVISSFATRNYDLLEVACKDKFHEPYRAKYIDDYYSVKKLLCESGCVANFLSGAGPTIMGIKVESKNEKNISCTVKEKLNYLIKKWNFEILKPDNIGAIVEER